MSSVRAWLTLLALASGCREYGMCDGGSCSAGGGGPGPAASAGNGACSAPFADCDGSTLNGCETNTATDPAHCGRCLARCRGLCASASCVEFESLATDRAALAARPVFNSEFGFLVTDQNVADGLVLERWSRDSGQVQRLAAGAWASVRALAATPSRLYIASERGLSSLPIAGGDLRDEGVDADAIAASGSVLAVLEGGRLLLREGDVGPFRAVDGIENAVFLVATPTTLAVGTAPTADEYEVHWFDVELEELVRIDAGSGTLTALGAVGPGESEIYFAVAASDDATDVRLYQRSEESRVELKTLLGVDDWVLTNGLLIIPFIFDDVLVAAFDDGAEHGLRFVWLLDPRQTIDWPTTAPVSRLGVDGAHLWFVDAAENELVRVSLERLLERSLAWPASD